MHPYFEANLEPLTNRAMITHCFLLSAPAAAHVAEIVGAKCSQSNTLAGVSTIGQEADFKIGQMADAWLTLLADGREQESVWRCDDYRTALTPCAPDHA